MAKRSSKRHGKIAAPETARPFYFEIKREGESRRFDRRTGRSGNADRVFFVVPLQSYQGGDEYQGDNPDMAREVAARLDLALARLGGDPEKVAANLQINQYVAFDEDRPESEPPAPPWEERPRGFGTRPFRIARDACVSAIGASDESMQGHFYHRYIVSVSVIMWSEIGKVFRPESAPITWKERLTVKRIERAIMLSEPLPKPKFTGKGWIARLMERDARGRFKRKKRSNKKGKRHANRLDRDRR